MPEYGEIHAYYKSWGDPDRPGTFYTRIPTRPCTPKELNLEEKSEDDPVKFWPYTDTSIGDISAFAKNFKCIDDNLEVYGDYNSARAQHLSILFEKCNPSKRACKSPEEIRKFTTRKFILTLQNQKRFDLEEYDQD